MGQGFETTLGDLQRESGSVQPSQRQEGKQKQRQNETAAAAAAATGWML